MTALEKFERWFVEPLRLLATMKNGDGAFVALQISFALWERLVKSDIKDSGLKASPDEFFSRSSSRLAIDRDVFELFWGMYRDGIQHYLQPKVFTSKGVTYGWEIDESYSEKPVVFELASDKKVIQINPWKWSELVLNEWRKRIDLLQIFESHAFGAISA